MGDFSVPGDCWERPGFVKEHSATLHYRIQNRKVFFAANIEDIPKPIDLPLRKGWAVAVDGKRRSIYVQGKRLYRKYGRKDVSKVPYKKKHSKFWRKKKDGHRHPVSWGSVELPESAYEITFRDEDKDSVEESRSCGRSRLFFWILVGPVAG